MLWQAGCSESFQVFLAHQLKQPPRGHRQVLDA